MAKLDPKVVPLTEPNYETKGGFRDIFAAQEAEFAKLQAASDAIDLTNPNVSLKGALVRWQRADGYAWYMVSKDKPLTLAHVPILDAWTVEAALIRGLTRADILAMLRREQAFSKMFKNKKGQ